MSNETIDDGLSQVSSAQVRDQADEVTNTHYFRALRDQRTNLKSIDPQIRERAKQELQKARLEDELQSTSSVTSTNYFERLVALRPLLKGIDNEKRSLATREIELTRRLTTGKISPEDLAELQKIRAVTDSWDTLKEAA